MAFGGDRESFRIDFENLIEPLDVDQIRLRFVRACVNAMGPPLFNPDDFVRRSLSDPLAYFLHAPLVGGLCFGPCEGFGDHCHRSSSRSAFYFITCVHCAITSPIIMMDTVRSLALSSSMKKTRCHLPSCKSPFNRFSVSEVRRNKA